MAPEDIKPENADVKDVKAENPEAEKQPDPIRERGQGRRPQGRRPRRPREIVASDFIEKVVSINRVTKVTKGGKKMSFSALVVVGDAKGQVGYNLGKSNEVANSIKKALIAAKKSMIKVSLKGSTIPHEILGRCGAAVVMLKPASDGTGVIAAGPVRAICDCVGIRNILTKCHKSNNPINVIKATMDGLSRLKVQRVEEIPVLQPEDKKEEKDANT